MTPDGLAKKSRETGDSGTIGFEHKKSRLTLAQLFAVIDEKGGPSK